MRKIITIVGMLAIISTAHAETFSCEIGELSHTGSSYFCVSRATPSCPEGKVLAYNQDHSAAHCFEADSTNRSRGTNPINACEVGSIAMASDGPICISVPVDKSPAEETSF